ncbi:helix-turn-helix transcriptional regulator [Streptomyces pseudogriseolus]|uniref:helix-turn-helix transcriptional regulator n=1 Tax=Streptomyces pseudogriseolus TaxID=36817 RepID=UPI003FA2A7F1
MSTAERLVDTTQIVSEFGTSKPRISEWSNNPDSGFPAVAHTEGRKRFWRYDEVAAFFAQRAPKKRTLPAAVLEADQDELLTKREVAQLLGYTRTSTIDAYFRDRPGYFPEPDEDIDGPRWRRGTVVAWAANRPGKGRRGSAPAAALPKVPIDGDPDELLGTAEVASLLGYGSTASFSSALYQGRIPELPQPETLEKQAGSRGGARKKWRRATVIAAARERGVLPAAGQDEDLVGAAEAARILGYGNADSFISALGHGLLPDLEQPDGFEYRRGSAGRPRQQRWRRSRVEELAARRSSTT